MTWYRPNSLKETKSKLQLKMLLRKQHPLIGETLTGKNFSVYAVNPTATYKAFHEHGRRAEFYQMCRKGFH